MHSLTFTAESGAGLRSEILAFFGPPLAGTVPVQGDADLGTAQGRIIELIEANANLARESLELEGRVDELEADITRRDETLTAIARLLDAVPDQFLPSLVADELTRRANKIAHLEDQVQVLKLDLQQGVTHLPTFKAGDLVTATWPETGATAPGVVKGDDPEFGTVQVAYYDRTSDGESGLEFFSRERLAHRSAVEAGDPPAPKKRSRKPKAEANEAEKPESPVTVAMINNGQALDQSLDPVEMPEGVDPVEYAAWASIQTAKGVTDGVTLEQFKLLLDASLIDRDQLKATQQPEAPAIVITAQEGVTVETSSLAPETPLPNPTAPAAVQAAAKTIAAFSRLPEANLIIGEEVLILRTGGTFGVLSGVIETVSESKDGAMVNAGDGLFRQPAETIRARRVQFLGTDGKKSICDIAEWDALDKGIVKVVVAEEGAVGCNVPVDDLWPAPPEASAPPLPPEVQQELAEFNQLPPAQFVVGEKVAAMTDLTRKTIAVGHVESIPPGGTMARITFLGGSSDSVHRDSLRHLAPPQPQLTAVGGGADDFELEDF